MCVLSRFIRAWLFATPWTVTRQASLSMGFSRQEYWSGLSCPPAGDLPDPGIALTFFTCPALAGGFFMTSTTGYIMCSVTFYSFATQWTVAHQAPLSMEFSRPEYWSGLHIHIHMYIFINAHMYMRHQGLVPQLVKNLPAMWKTWVPSLSWEGPWRRERLHIPLFWPGEFHGPCSPWGLKESDMTERLSLSYIYIIESFCYTPEANTTL